MLNPEETWYRTKAVEFSRVQISVDFFSIAPTINHYTDLASLAALPKFTGGNLYYYPSFSVEKDGQKVRLSTHPYRAHSSSFKPSLLHPTHPPQLDAELSAVLTRPTGFEAVMRVRATRGLKVTQFYGTSQPPTHPPTYSFISQSMSLFLLPNHPPTFLSSLSSTHPPTHPPSPPNQATTTSGARTSSPSPTATPSPSSASR